MTVAVLSEPQNVERSIDVRDVEFQNYKAGGPGGQHQNKVETAVRATHLPTGLVARSESERSQGQNKKYALAALATKVVEARRSEVSAARSDLRRTQVGSGQRGDKVRTIRFQDGIVTCEKTGKKCRLKEYLRGELEWLK